MKKKHSNMGNANLPTYQTIKEIVVKGTKAGGDMLDGVRINGIRNGRQYTLKPDLSAGGVAFYDGAGDDAPAVREAKLWIKAILEDTEPFVKAEQAFVVTQILEGIYESAKTGKPYYFN